MSSQSTSGSVPPSSSTIARMHSRISALFHGTSIHTSGPFTSSSRGPKSPCPSEAIPSRRCLYIPQPMTRPLFHPRSPTSTRSVIDPASSPASSARPATAHSYLRLIMSPALALQSVPASPAGIPDSRCQGPHPAGGNSGRRRRRRRRRRQGAWERVQTTSPSRCGSVRHRVYTCLVLGISLVVVLTICALRLRPTIPKR